MKRMEYFVTREERQVDHVFVYFYNCEHYISNVYFFGPLSIWNYNYIKLISFIRVLWHRAESCARCENVHLKTKDHIWSICLWKCQAVGEVHQEAKGGLYCVLSLWWRNCRVSDNHRRWACGTAVIAATASVDKGIHTFLGYQGLSRTGVGFFFV
jgi:hypothetical protein